MRGNALRATARIVQVVKDTVCAWLHRVACHCRTVMLSFWHDLHVSACQLDELGSFVHTKEAHLPGAKISCDTSGDAWVGIAFAPVWRLVLAFVIGKRDQECSLSQQLRDTIVFTKRLCDVFPDELNRFPKARAFPVASMHPHSRKPATTWSLTHLKDTFHAP